MLFNEVYGSYYNVVAAILSEAVSGELTDKRIDEIIRRKAFGESVLSIPAALRNGSWPLLTKDNKTPLEHTPVMPLTALQKRWLKALLADPRIGLFSPPHTGLKDVEPLYSADVFRYFDRYSNADPYEKAEYIEHFRTILTALRKKLKLHIVYTGSHGARYSCKCVPNKLEYSSKDDKFRLIASSERGTTTVNIARIIRCVQLEPWKDGENTPCEPLKETLVLELTDERNTLERVMLHFSHLEKQTQRTGNGQYLLKLRYDCDDETEMIIRVLSFGPTVRVISPDVFVKKIKERLRMQNELRV